MREQPSLLRAAVTVLGTFVAVSVLWVRISPLYNDAIAAAANVLLLPDDLWLESFARSIVVRHMLDGEAYRESINALVLHSGLLVIVALVSGTPWRSLRWRALAACYVAACFFLVQIVGLAVYALLLRGSLQGGVASPDVNVGFAIFWALTPIAVGGAWGYRFWLPAIRPRGPAEQEAAR